MQDMIAAGETWFRSQRREHLATEVSYQPSVGLTRTVRATAVVGRWESIDASGQMLRTETQDFFVDTTDLVQDPKRGDRIVAGGFTYEVMIPPGAEHHWRWSDRNKTLRRIHTMVTEGPATRTPAVPGPPTAVAGVNALPVTWTAPVVVGEYGVTSYKVYVGDVLQETVTAPSTTTVGTFSFGTVVRVSAVNAIGEGAKASATVAAGVPGKPTITLANTSQAIQWTTPSTGGSPLTSYKLYRNGEQVEPDGGDAPWTTETLESYAAGSVMRVRAVNAIGDGPLSDPVTVSA